MNKPIDIAKKLSEEIKNTELVQEYLRLFEAVKKDEYLKDLKNKILECKNLTVKQKLIDEFRLNPLVNNLEILKDDVSSLLHEIEKILK